MGLIKEIGKNINAAVTSQDKVVVKKYPKSIQLPNVALMKKAGTYKNGFPEGIILHFTAGWQNQKPSDAISSANKSGYRFFFIAADGSVVQNFDLSGYGGHAGESLCPVTKRSGVSKYYVGIEVACAGSLSDVDKDGAIDDTWFKQLNLPADTVRSGEIKNKWQTSKGVFQKFTPAQEAAILELCIWLCRNGCNPDLIFGHDEVAPKRKNDPGLSLSMSMDDFRKTIKQHLLDPVKL